MARAAVLGRLSWRLARVVESVSETPRVKTLVFEIPEWPGHRAGQHVDVRLTAEDGYQAQRSYSIASAPEESRLALTVERLEDGEVSPFLCDELMVGEQVEIRGPIGGYFVWEASMNGPFLLVAGGSGIVPLMSIIRHRGAVGRKAPVRLLFSSRSIEDVIYRAELERLETQSNGLQVFHTLTRSQPSDWKGYGRRIDKQMLSEVAWPAKDNPLAFICGPTPFVETAAQILVELGYDAALVKTERFGPTGG